MKYRNSSAVAIFIGGLLTFCFVIGLVYLNNPEAIWRLNRTSFAWMQFARFCSNWFYIFGMIGIPTLIISLIVSLIRESRNRDCT